MSTCGRTHCQHGLSDPTSVLGQEGSSHSQADSEQVEASPDTAGQNSSTHWAHANPSCVTRSSFMRGKGHVQAPGVHMPFSEVHWLGTNLGNICPERAKAMANITTENVQSH
mmetsp:Transcript_60603/g.125438  ORF Transcript_60603/g.125438 Transcript_60603/m.125438 type:complete len:112 (+) Transcript_60603:216-551(+)